jgi:hypothetical protein
MIDDSHTRLLQFSLGMKSKIIFFPYGTVVKYLSIHDDYYSIPEKCTAQAANEWPLVKVTKPNQQRVLNYNNNMA